MKSDSRKSSPDLRVTAKPSIPPTVSTSTPSFSFAFQIRKPTSRPSAQSPPITARLPPQSSRSGVSVQEQSPRNSDFLKIQSEKEQRGKSTAEGKSRGSEKGSGRGGVRRERGEGESTEERSSRAERKTNAKETKNVESVNELRRLPGEEKKLLLIPDKPNNHKRNSSAAPDPVEPAEADISGQFDITEAKPVKQKLHSRSNSFSDLSEAKPVSRASLALTAEYDQEEKARLVEVVKTAYLSTGEPPITTSEFYRYGKMLGKGAFGKVSLAVHRLTGLNIAIKSIEKSYMKDERASKKVFQEVLAMRRIRHPHVARLFEVFESSRHFNMVQEYVGGGDLLQFVRTRGKLTEGEAAMIFAQIVEAIGACHDKHIVHRDIKLDNILLDASYTTIKLCDFGVSRLVKPGQTLSDQCGTPAYIAPEIIANRTYTAFPVDIWSLGVVLYAMLTGTVPFRGKNMPDLQKLILKGQFEDPPGASEEAKDLIRGMLKIVPGQRLTLEEVRNHAWVAATHEEEEMFDSTVPRFVGSEELSIGRVAATGKTSEGVLRRMEELGFPRHSVLASLYDHEINHATATYDLLETHGTS